VTCVKLKEKSPDFSETLNFIIMFTKTRN